MITYSLFIKVFLFILSFISQIMKTRAYVFGLVVSCTMLSLLIFHKNESFTKIRKAVAGTSDGCGIAMKLDEIYDAIKLQKLVNKTTDEMTNRKTASETDDDSESFLKRRKVVILLTQMRSGSSVIGELFNQKIGVPYFYEPVYPFGEIPCTAQWRNRTQVIENIAHCRLDRLTALYTEAFERTHRTDGFAR